MRYLPLIVLAYFLYGCSDKEHSATDSRPAESIASKTSSAITERNASNIPRSSKNYIGVSLLGISFSDFLSHFDYDRTEVSEGMLYAFKNGKPIFALSDKNELKDKIVWHVEVISPNLTSEKGVHVGMSITELLRDFPDLELQMSHEDGEEFFEPVELQKLNTQFPDVTILINVGSTHGTPLGSGNLWEYPTRRYRTDGVVSSIYIFKSGGTESAAIKNLK